MKEIEEIASFEEGDEVPEWLIQQDPTNANSIKGNSTFTVGVLLIKWRGEYWFLPHNKRAQYLLEYSGGTHIELSATTNTLNIPTQWVVFNGKDIKEPQ